MLSNDQQQIELIFHEALDRKNEDRAEYLDLACSGNESIHSEVRALITAFESSNGLLEEAAFELGMKVICGKAIGSMVDRAVGPYKVLKLLGTGGMGEVYLAEDSRLERRVALKFLSQEFVGDNWAKRQLVKEAQAVAMIDHPNVCAVYGMEEEGGLSFIVMQFVEGDTLAQMIRSRGLSDEQMLPLAQQIISSLAEAHNHGIIHRDIKPKNIMVTSNGQVKVLDFGLAKSIQQKQELTADSISHLSETGMVLGTVAYMSPEQLRGEKLDYRSDIFSAGTVLYEMAAGKNPFARSSDAEVISAILTSSPPPLNDSGGMPAVLSRIALKCLEKEKEKRYASASELLYDLDNLQTLAKKPARWLQFPRFWPLAFALLLVIAASAFLYIRLNRVYTLAVLPINNESADASLDYLEDGFADSLIVKLSRLTKLKVNAFTTVSGYRRKNAEAQQIGRKLGVDAVLASRIIRQGNSLVLQTDLINTSDGSEIWGKRYNIDTEAITHVQENITERIAASLQLQIGNNEAGSPVSHEARNDEAFKEYLRGRFYWQNRNKENIQKAIEKFKAAIELDPAFAKAYAGLADCYVLMNTTAYGNMPTKEAMSRAKAAARQALLIDETLPEAHTSLGVVSLKYDWDWAEAEKEFRRAISLRDDYAPAHYWYSNLLTVTGRQAEAEAESEIAKRLDPFSLSTRMNFCREFYYGRNFEKAATCFQEMLKEDPGNSGAQHVLGYIYLQQGRTADGIEMFKNLPDNNRALKAVALAYSYGKAGQKTEALRLLAEAQILAKDGYVSPFEFAVIYLGLEDKDNLFFWLDQAYKERSASLIAVMVEPAFDGMRTDPRFDELLRRLNFRTP